MKAAVRKEVASMGKKKTYRGELVDEIRGLGQSQGLNHVFTTFLEVAATCISAEMDPSNAEEREKRYEEMASAMDPKTLNCYAHMLALLALATAVNCSICFCGCVGRVVYRSLFKRAYSGNCLYQNCYDFLPRSTHSVLFTYPGRQHITCSVLFAPIKCDFLRINGLVKRRNARHWNKSCRAVGTLPCMAATVFCRRAWQAQESTCVISHKAVAYD